MKVLVTGGAGFIGHNVAIYLKSRGYEAIALDNLKRTTEFACKRLAAYNVPIIKGDVLNTNVLKSAFSNVDIVVHAAAHVSVEESMKKPAMYFKNNVAGTANVAHVCLRKGVKLLIYVSSAAVYGNPITLPISETHPTNPISPYGLSKLMGEEVVKFYGGRGLKYVILRLFNAYGPGQSRAYAGVITRFIERLSEGKPPIIYGDGEQTRDFIHVYDVAEAIRLLIERGVENEIINLGSGKPTAIKELAELMIKLTNRNLKPIFTKARPGEIRHSYADTSKARRLLNFEPSIDLERGLGDLLGLKVQSGELVEDSCRS